ncbi:tripartite motif-containing protein 14-like [Hyperolius riggenbachi]|uniref:tripartite motif-containing protein 14-like n=1 Tax=Hyperolius riggenbachi TaxID=752182 RepID=UPI0035A2B101
MTSSSRDLALTSEQAAMLARAEGSADRHGKSRKEHLKEYKCPKCQKIYLKKPGLIRNTAFHNVSGAKSVRHNLLPPTTDLEMENRKCSVHKKTLEYYCTEDAACACVSCYVIGGHVGHKMMSLDEASEEKKKKLRNDLQKLMAETEKTEKRVQSLKERKRKAQEKADGETERVTVLFSDLRRRLEQLEKRVLSDITRQAQQVSQSYNYIIQQLEIKKQDLSRKMRRIEELCNMTDPLTVLQESDTGDLCDTEDRERHDKQLHDGGDLDVAGILHTLHTGLSDIMSGVIVQKHTDTQAYPHSSTEDKVPITATLSRPRPQPRRFIQHKLHQFGGAIKKSLQKTSGLPVYADILLDVTTAGNYLHISADRKTVSRADSSQNRPETPEIFQCLQVLSSQRFSSGRHYWEVDFGGSVMWRVGMCYPSIARRGPEAVIGSNDKSWALYRWNNQYTVRHNSEKIQLPDKIPSDRVRICLDYEAGQISFYALCDPIRHLHTFTATFTEPLHAVFWIWRGSIKIGRNQGI